MPDTTLDPDAISRRLAELLGYRVDPVTHDSNQSGIHLYRLRYPAGWSERTRLHIGTDPEECWRASIPDFYHDANAALRALEAVRSDVRWGKTPELHLHKHWDGPLQWRCALLGRRVEDDANGQADTLPAALTLACIAALEKLAGEQGEQGEEATRG
jgi:hypothetical protein